MKDVNTIANLLSVDGAADTFWREAHSRNTDVQGPSRSLIARAFTSAACRKRLNLHARTRRVADLLEKVCEEAKVAEEYNIGPIKKERNGKGGGDDDDDVRAVPSLLCLPAS